MTDDVRQAAALMDRWRPGWAPRIDVGLLDLESCGLCIVGQSGGWDDAVDTLIRFVYASDMPTLVFCSNRYRDDWIEAVAERVAAQSVPAEPEREVTV